MGLSKSGRNYMIKQNVLSYVTIMDSWSVCADEIEVDRVARSKLGGKAPMLAREENVCKIERDLIKV